MAETRLVDIDSYKNVTPTVFKRVGLTDSTVTPFMIHKAWTVFSGSSTSSCLPLNAVYSDTNNLPPLNTNLTYNDKTNIDGTLQTVSYYSINHLFYKRKFSPYSTFGGTNLENTKKFLYQSASIFSFPYFKIGEGIKPASFELYTSNDGFYGSGIYGSSLYGSSMIYNLKSDLYGNIYDTQIDTSSIISDVKFYEGFNEYFDTTRIAFSKQELSDVTKQPGRYISGSINFVSGINSTDGILLPIGIAAEFNNTGIMVIPNESISGRYDRDHDYALSFFISASATGSTNQSIITKSGTRSPYDIVLDTDKKIRFYIHGAIPVTSNTTYIDDPLTSKHVFISSSTAVSSSWNHIICQKSGSYMQIYVNGVLESNIDQPLLKISNSPLSQSMRIDSLGDTYIGGRSISNNFIGKLDEIRIYNKSLTATQVGYLGDLSETGSLLQTNIIGNVFHKQGIAVISSPNYIYNNLIYTSYTASYKSTVTRYEMSTLVKANAGDFNMSLNSSLLKDNDVSYYDFVSGSTFSPYITTIGLYNDHGQLLAIGKLAQPIKKRSDVDLNFLVRIDLDKNVI